MEVMSKDILPEVFNQIIITYCNTILLLIKMETSNTNRCIHISVNAFYNNLIKEIENNNNTNINLLMTGGIIIVAEYIILTSY
jgi:Na+/proline symporter